MSDKTSRTGLIERRGELLVELFLQELGPLFVAQATRDSIFDYFVGFENSRGGINNVAVEVRTKERMSRRDYPLPKRAFGRLAYSNIPVLLVVVDAKENHLYYAWITREQADRSGDSNTVRVELSEINEETKRALKDRLVSDELRP